MGEEHVELLRQAVHAPKPFTGVPPALRRMHGRKMAEIREQRETVKHPWGPGSQPSQDEGAP